MDPVSHEQEIKTESTELTSTIEENITNQTEVDLGKHNCDYFINSEHNIKIEPQDDEIFPKIDATSSGLDSEYNIKDEVYVKSEIPMQEDDMSYNSAVLKNEIKDNKEEFKDKFYTEEKTGEESISENIDTGSYSNQEHWKSTNPEIFAIQYEHVHKYQRKYKYPCNVCEKIFRQKSELNNHIRTHTGVKPFPCTVCEKVFSQKGNLDRHLLIHSDRKPHICIICQKSFSDRSTLVRHNLIHTNEKPYMCDICNKQFRNNFVLTKHKRIHNGDKPFACDVCVKVFTRKDALSIHRRVHTGNKPYTCEICNKSFNRNDVLKKHKSTQHNLLPPI